MSRLPFDPGRAAGGAEPGRSARRERKLFENVAATAQLTVSQVAELIKSTLESRIPSPLRVVGQVSNLSCGGHWYFSLKDEAAVLSCVAWASSAGKFGFTPADGDEVVATGHVSHYGPQGRTQFYVSRLQPVGAGALELRFRALCEELRSLGYFEETRKKPLRVFPRRIAVITSASGAAVQDVIATAAQRCKAVALLIVDVRVQGEGAAQQVAGAIRWVDEWHTRLGVDAMLVTRGGGSLEDLWAFNERVVADAAFGCSIPLVAAIGHESDVTVIELVADLRAATPTQAAMRLVPSSADLQRHISHEWHRLAVLMRRTVEQRRHGMNMIERHPLLRDPAAFVRAAAKRSARLRIDLTKGISSRLAAARIGLEQLGARLGRLRPEDLAARRREQLAVIEDRLRRALARRVDQRDALRAELIHLAHAGARHARIRRERMEALDRQLRAVDPQRVLGRGYSLTTHADGRLIRSVREVRARQPITTRLADGAIESVVRSVGARSHARRAPGGRTPSADQMDLFGRGQ